MRFLIAALITLYVVAPASAQRIVGALTENEVSITSSFTGETLTLFGNVESDVGQANTLPKGPFQVVVVVSGPALDRVARRKTSVFGIWLNTEQVRFENYPSFYRVMASAPLGDIAGIETLEDSGILNRASQENITTSGNGAPKLFAQELERLMDERGLFSIEPRGVQFNSPTLFSARISLPANVPNGRFLAETYLFRDGEMLTKKVSGFLVRKQGFERFLGDLAHNYSLFYGLLCVSLAIFTGWLGGVIFRR